MDYYAENYGLHQYTSNAILSFHVMLVLYNLSKYSSFAESRLVGDFSDPNDLTMSIR
jgi:hypothetical protein